jgi:hypothetical protein
MIIKLCIVLKLIVILCMFLFKQTHAFPGSKYKIEYKLSFLSIFFSLCKDFRSLIQRWANSELTVIDHMLKVFMGRVTYSMNYLIFVGYFKTSFAIHVTVVS